MRARDRICAVCGKPSYGVRCRHCWGLPVTAKQAASRRRQLREDDTAKHAAPRSGESPESFACRQRIVLSRRLAERLDALGVPEYLPQAELKRVSRGVERSFRDAMKRLGVNWGEVMALAGRMRPGQFGCKACGRDIPMVADRGLTGVCAWCRQGVKPPPHAPRFDALLSEIYRIEVVNGGGGMIPSATRRAMLRGAKAAGVVVPEGYAMLGLDFLVCRPQWAKRLGLLPTMPPRAERCKSFAPDARGGKWGHSPGDPLDSESPLPLGYQVHGMSDEAARAWLLRLVGSEVERQGRVVPFAPRRAWRLTGALLSRAGIVWSQAVAEYYGPEKWRSIQETLAARRRARRNECARARRAHTPHTPLAGEARARATALQRARRAALREADRAEEAASLADLEDVPDDPAGLGCVSCRWGREMTDSETGWFCERSVFMRCKPWTERVFFESKGD